VNNIVDFMLCGLVQPNESATVYYFIALSSTALRVTHATQATRTKAHTASNLLVLSFPMERKLSMNTQGNNHNNNANNPPKRTKKYLALLGIASFFNACIMWLVFHALNAQLHFLMFQLGAASGEAFAVIKTTNWSGMNDPDEQPLEKEPRFKWQLVCSLAGGVALTILWGGMTFNAISVLPFAILAILVGIATGMAFASRPSVHA
jgi:hypothetical protein